MLALWVLSPTRHLEGCHHASLLPSISSRLCPPPFGAGGLFLLGIRLWWFLTAWTSGMTVPVPPFLVSPTPLPDVFIPLPPHRCFFRDRLRFKNHSRPVRLSPSPHPSLYVSQLPPFPPIGKTRAAFFQVSSSYSISPLPRLERSTPTTRLSL